MRLLLILISCFFFFTSSPQLLKKPIAAVYPGLGAYSVKQADVFSFSANQAALAQMKNISAGIYAEKRFLLAELNNYNAAFALPAGPGGFGLTAGYYGFSEYNETQLGLAYARKLGNKLDIGVQFNYNGISISGYGNAAAVSFEMGSIIHITEQLHAGIQINNPVGGKFGKDGQEKLPSVYSFGLGYDASEKFFAAAEIVKEENQPVNVNAGIQYKFIPQLLARLGVASATSSFWLGAGLLWKTFRVDVTSSYHPQLGFTPGILILFDIKKKED